MATPERYLAVGDIHGCPEQLEQILDLGRALPDHRWVFLGDYINRGPDAERVIQRLRGLDAVFLRGNHEERFLEQWTNAPTSAERRACLDATGLSAASAQWLLEVPLPRWSTPSLLFVHADEPGWEALTWVVHGHVPVDRPLVAGNRINVNTRCGAGGPLTAVALPELLFLQSSPSPAPPLPTRRLEAWADDELEELPSS